MTTLKQQFAIGGQAISNLDKDMVITLDAHPSVQIDTIQEDSITYKFLGDITQDASYKLNLTFVYKKLHKLVMPVTLTHVVNDPNIQVSWPVKAVDVWSEGTWDDIPFTVMFLGTDPAEDITASITNLVMVSNEYITITDNTNWRVTKGDKTQPIKSNVNFTFDVEHDETVYHCQGVVVFNITKYDGVDYKVKVVGVAEGTLNTPSKIYFKPTYQGRFSPGSKISPTSDASIRVTINSQADDLEKELMVVTITGTTVNDAIYNRFIFYKDGNTGNGATSDVVWFYIKIWAKAITVTGAPTRTDTKYQQTYKYPITEIRLGHEKVTPQDSRLTITGSSLDKRAILGFVADGIWMQNLNDTVGGFVNTTTDITCPGYTAWSLMTASYTTEVGEDLTLVPIETSPVVASTHNDVSILVRRVESEEEIPGLTLLGKPSIKATGPKALIKYYDNAAISDTPAVGTLTLGMDIGHTGTAVKLSGAFKTPDGDVLGLRDVQIDIPKAPMVAAVAGPVDVSKVAAIPVQFTLKQLQFDNTLTNVATATFSGMSVTGEATAIGTITNKTNGLYEAQITPTAETGTATVKGTVTVSESGTNVTYPVEFAIQFNRISDVVFTDQPLNVNVFQQGTDIPFRIAVEGADVTAQITDVVITPTTNVITSGGANWEIWTAPTAGVAEKVTYTFKITGWDGELEEHTYVATFNIAAWDGKMFKFTSLEPLIGASTARDTTFEVTPVYRGKPAADKIELQTFGNMAGYVNLVSITPSEDNTKAVITIRGKTTNVVQNVASQPLVVTGIKFKIKGSEGDVADVNSITWTGNVQGFFTGDYLGIFGMGWCFTGQSGEVTYMRNTSATGPRSAVYAFANGVRVPLEDLYVYSLKGTSTTSPTQVAFYYMYGEGTSIYAQITAPYNSASGYHNLIRAQVASNPAYTFNPAGTDANFWVYVNVAGALQTTVNDGVVTATPANDNSVEYSLKNNNRTLTSPTIRVTKVTKSPASGNALMPAPAWTNGISPTDPNKGMFKFPAGHTGDTVYLEGTAIDSGMSGRISRMSVTITVPKSTPTATPDQTDYPAKGGQVIDVGFSLDLKHYKNVSADLSGITFKSISVNGAATGSDLPTHVEGNKFKLPVTTGTQFGTVSVTGTFTEPDSTVEYGFAMTFTTVNNSTVHVVGISPFNVGMFERDTRLPFTVSDTEGDITSTVKNVTITPNQYVITHGGSDWEIWTGPKEGGTTKVMYQFTVTSKGADETMTYEATFTLPAWDGKMLTVGYNYEEENKKTLLTGTPVGGVQTTTEYTVYPLYRNKPAPEMVTLRSSSMAGVSGTLTNTGTSTDAKGIKIGFTANYVQAQGINNGKLVYTLKDEYLNGQANNIEDVTAVTHDVKLRTYIPNGMSMIMLQPKENYPTVKLESGFGVAIELREDKAIVDLDNPGIKYALGGTTVAVRYVGANKENVYFTCIANGNDTLINNLNATYNGKSSAYASFQYIRNTTVTPLPALINILPDQVLEAGSEGVVKFTLNKKATPAVVSKTLQLKATSAINTPTTGLALSGNPKARLATMDSEGIWSLPVLTGHTGDSFKLEGAVFDPDNAVRDEWAQSYSNSVTVKKAVGIGTSKTPTLEVLGNTRTRFVFTMKMKQASGLVDITAGTFKTISITGAASQAAANVPAYDSAAGGWSLPNVVLNGAPGKMKVSGTFTLTGDNTTVYNLSEFEVEVVNVSTVVFTNTYPKVDVFSRGTTTPFTVADDTGALTPSSTVCNGGEKVLGNGVNWTILAVNEEGERISATWAITVTSHGTAETHNVVGYFDVNPWDGVQFSFGIAGNKPSTLYVGLGKTGSFTLSGLKFDYTSPNTAGTQWKTNKDKLLANTDGCLTWVSDSNPSPANNPTIVLNATKVGKMTNVLLPIDYVGPGYDRWPVGTLNKNFAVQPFDIWVWDYDIRFASGTKPDTIVGTPGGQITIPSDLVYANDLAVYTPSATITILTPNIISVANSSNQAKSWTASVIAVNNGTDIDVPVKIKYDYSTTTPAATYTMTYDQVITVKGSGTGDVAAATNVTSPTARNWQKGVLPFGVTINGVAATVKSVSVKANENVKAIPKDALNNVWQVTKGDSTKDITVPVEFTVVANAGLHDVELVQTVNITITKDDGSEFWITPVSYTNDYDGLVAIRNNNINTNCNAQVYGYYRGDRVVTTATFTGLTGTYFGSQVSAMAADGKWTYAFKHTNNSFAQMNTLTIRLKYGTDTEVEGKNVASFSIPVFFFVTTSGSPLQVIVSNPKVFTGKFGDTFLHNLNMADRGAPVDMTNANTAISYTAGGDVLAPVKAFSSRYLQHAFKQDVEEETQTTVTVRVQSGLTLAVNASVSLTFIQQPLIPKLPLTVSQTTDIVGKLNDTGSMPLTVTYGGDIVPTNDPKLTITADTGIQLTQTADGFDYKITLANTNPTGNYTSNITVKYEYASGKFATTTFVQGIKFTATARELTLTDAPIPVKVWDIGTAAPFTLKAGTEDVTNLITNLKVTNNTYVVQKAYSVWQIVANTAISSIEVLTEFTYRLSDESLVRTGSGTFIIADYDGTEFAPYFDKTNSGANEGYLMIPNGLANSVASPAITARVVGLYRGETVAILANGAPTGTGLEVTAPSGTANTLQYQFKSNVVNGFGGDIVNISVKRSGAANNDIGMGTNVVPVPYIIFDSTKAAYVIGDMTKTLGGVYGDELTVKCVVVDSGNIVDLTDPNIVIEFPSDRVELVPGSVTRTGFKLRFTGKTATDVVGNQQVNIRNTATPTLTTTGTISLTQVGVTEDTLTVAISPEETTGATGEIFTITPTITFNGEVIAVNDPDMTLSVTPDTGLEIVNVTDTTIELKVIADEDQATDFIAQLIVTKGTASVTTPWLHHYTVPEKPYEISVTKETTILIPAENNIVLFTLRDGDGNPVTNATKVSMDVKDNPKSRFVLAGYSNTLTNNSASTPGEYRLSMNLGQTAGTFTISLTVAVPDKTESYKLEDMVFNNPGSPVVVKTEPNTIDAVEDKETNVTVTLTQSKYLQPNAKAGGYFHVVTIDGPVKSITPSLVNNDDGIYPLDIKSTGVEGPITIEAEYVPVVNGINWSPIPVTVKLNGVTPEVTAPVLTDATTEMTLQLWEQKPIAFKVMAGEVDITESASVTLDSDVSSNLEFTSISEGVWGFKAIAADSLEDVILSAKVKVNIHHDGQDYQLPLELNVTVAANTTGIPVNRFNIDFI